MSKKIIHFLFLALFSCSEKPPKTEAPQARKQVAFVVCAGIKSIEVLDLQSHQKVDTYPITSKSNKFPRGISLSADKTILAIANPSYDFSLGHLGLHGKQYAGAVVLMDASNGRVLSDFELPIANYNVLFDGDEIWTTLVSHSGRANVYTYSGELKHEMILDADPTNLVFSGSFAVATSIESTFLQVFDRKAKELIKKVKVDISPDNVWPGYDDKVLVTNADDSSINIVDLTALKVIDYLDTPFAPQHIVYHKGNEEFWICDKLGGKVHIYKKQDGAWEETRAMDFAGEEPFIIQFYANEQTAILITQKGQEAVFVDTKTKEIMKRTAIGEKPSGLVISE